MMRNIFKWFIPNSSVGRDDEMRMPSCRIRKLIATERMGGTLKFEGKRAQLYTVGGGADLPQNFNQREMKDAAAHQRRTILTLKSSELNPNWGRKPVKHMRIDPSVTSIIIIAPSSTLLTAVATTTWIPTSFPGGFRAHQTNKDHGRPPVISDCRAPCWPIRS